MSWDAVQPYAPFALLDAALLLFLLSTRQWPIWARSLIWLIGAGALAGAAILAQGENHYGLYGLVGDALRSGPAHSALKQTLVGNWPTVTGNLSPMFDIVTAMAVLLAIVALIAFTPGERLERTIRPVFLMLFGAIIGGFLALAFVALGLGGYQKDRVYAARLTADNVIDGDTLKLGDISLRLWASMHPSTMRAPSGQRRTTNSVAPEIAAMPHEGNLSASSRARPSYAANRQTNARSRTNCVRHSEDR